MTDVGFDALPDDVRDDLEEMRPATRHVYQLLRAEDDGLSIEEIAEATMFDERTVRRARRELQEAGLAESEGYTYNRTLHACDPDDQP